MQQQVEPVGNIIAIHPYLLQKFMKYEKDFANLLALYTFYLYHANIQKTNSILATDEFTKNGLHWALDRVKRIKRLLKKLGVIVVQQRGYYSYIKLVYLYTKKKIEQLVGADSSREDKTETKSNTAEKKVQEAKPKEETRDKEEIEKPKTEEKKSNEAPKKSIFVKVLEENHLKSEKIEEIRGHINKNIKKFKVFNPLALAKWIGYCHRTGIPYNNESIEGWIKKLQLKPSIEQLEVVNQAIESGWKNFYMPSKDKSKYQKYLGRHLKIKHDILDTLIDIKRQANGEFLYVFKINSVLTPLTIDKLFEKYEYIKPDRKIDSRAIKNFQDKFKDLVNSKRF